MASPMRILHVDDDAEFAEVTAEFLEQELESGVVETAPDAETGLDRLNEEIDCVVSDYEMPGLDGIGFLEAVREESPDLPFILFTGRGSEAVASTAISAGATDYLQKQSGTEQYELLANRIENAVDQYRSERRLRRTQREYATMFRNAEDDLLLLDVTEEGFRYRRCNPSELESTGLSRDDLVGKTPSEVLGAENARPVERMYRECVEQAEPLEYTVELDYPVGTRLRECRVAPVVVDGEVIQLVVVSRDVTEERTHQRELEEMNDRIRLALQGSRSWLWDWNLETDDVTRSEVTGIDDGEAGSMTLALEETLSATLEKVHPEDRSTIPTAKERAVEGDGNYHAEYRLQQDGEIRWIESRGQVYESETGGPDRLIGIAMDITDRKSQERDQEIFRECIERLQDAIFVSEAETGDIVAVNETACQRLGYSREELLERSIFDIDPEIPDMATWNEHVERTRSQGRRFFEGRHQRRDGSTFPVEVSVGYVPIEDGYVIGVARDISDRKERKARLRRSERYFEAIIETPDTYMGVLDLDGTLRRVNQTAAEFAEVDPEEVIGEPFWETPWWNHSSETQERLQGWIEQAANGEHVRFESTHRAPDGTEIIVEGVIRPVTDDGEVIAMIVEGRNVTERREHKRELERQNDRLERFTSVVSHDLKNPLQIAKSRLELARDDCESPHLEDVEKVHERMGELIDDLLVLARQGDRVSEFESLDLGAVARRCWQTTATSDATVRVQTDRTIQADSSRLRQLLENLFRNAVEHGRTGSRTERGSDDAGEEVVVTVGDLDDGFYVADDGPGIPEDERDRIFESGYSTAERGTGFGLSIVEEIAQAHGWTVEVTDSEAGGARFEITGIESPSSGDA